MANGISERKRRESDLTLLMRFKFWFVCAGCMIAIIYLSYKILDLKNTNGDEFELIAINQLVTRGGIGEQSIYPNRGAIMDRNRQILAYSSIVYNVFIDVRRLSERSEEIRKNALDTLNSVLMIPMDTLESYLSTNADGKLAYDTHYLVVARQIGHSKATEITKASLWDVYLEEDSKRSYFYDSLAPQIVGFIRGESAWGLEGQYNKALSGVYGRIFRAYDSAGKSVVQERVEAEEGNTLITTLDVQIQLYAEDVCQKYGDIYNAKSTSAIVMDPNTGEILAMATYPSFNPSEPVNLEQLTKKSLAEMWSPLTQEEQIENLYSIWRNYNISYAYEPGSTFKPITVAAALEEGIISIDDTFYCSGSKYVAGHTIRCNKQHNWVTVSESLAYSCNVAMMEIAEKMGRDIFDKYLRAFGYGEKTGVDLPAEESAAVLLHPLSGLNAAELATASFGQRFKCTPLQVVSGFSALINGGNLYTPYVVAQTVNANRSIVYERKPVLSRKIISEETSAFIRTALVGTLEYGTGQRAFINGYNIGGKSGTAQQGLEDDPDYHEAASFIGYFPAENPQYVVYTMIYWPEGQTPSAAVMFNELVREIINYKDVQPSYGVNPEADTSEGSWILDDYRGRTLLETVNDLNSLGLEYELVGGSGSIIDGQFPNPGTRVTGDSMVFLMITETDDTVGLTEVPDITGLTVKQAADRLTAAGLKAYVLYDDDTNRDTEINIVYEQQPDAFFRIPEGTQVKIKAR